jgi:hypothetical protein
MKVGAVVAGYVVAAVVAIVAVAIHVAATSGPIAQGSSGMYAFGDAMLFAAVFGVLPLVPTAVALVFLRPYRPFWTVLATAGLMLAITGLAAAVLFAVGRHAEPTSAMSTWAGLSVLRILAAPLLTLVSLVCALVAPYRFSRLTLLAAMVVEAGVSAYGGFVWFLPLLVSAQ